MQAGVERARSRSARGDAAARRSPPRRARPPGAARRSRRSAPRPARSPRPPRARRRRCRRSRRRARPEGRRARAGGPLARSGHSRSLRHGAGDALAGGAGRFVRDDTMARTILAGDEKHRILGHKPTRAITSESTMSHHSRREFLRTAAIAAAGTPYLGSILSRHEESDDARRVGRSSGSPSASARRTGQPSTEPDRAGAAEDDELPSGRDRDRHAGQGRGVEGEVQHPER